MHNIFNHSMFQYKTFFIHVASHDRMQHYKRTFYGKLAEIFFLIKRNGKTFFHLQNWQHTKIIQNFIELQDRSTKYIASKYRETTKKNQQSHN